MPIRRSSSSILEKATARLENLKTIDDKLDLGSGYSLSAYDEKMTGVKNKMSAYQKAVSALDKAIMELDQSEEELNLFHVGMLGAVKVKFGDDSEEYETAGGIPRSKRKHPTRKSKTVEKAIA